MSIEMAAACLDDLKIVQALRAQLIAVVPLKSIDARLADR